MNNKKECVINRCYESKNGEFVMSVKFKFDELGFGEKELLREMWREGTPVELPLPSVFQDPNQSSL